MTARSGRTRDLRTILFTDIVASTERAEALGDAAWGTVLRRHRGMVRAALRRYAGTEMDTAGDGFFATFARPTDALACGAAIVKDAAGLDLHVRVGVHVGEIDLQDGKAGGIAVHVAARLMSAARPDEVLVSATARELTAGSGFRFADHGVLALKGLAEPVHAYDLAIDSAAGGGTLVGRPTMTLNRANVPLAASVAVVAAVAILITTYLAGGGHGGAAPTSPAATAAPSLSQVSPSSTNSSPWSAQGPENGFLGLDPGGDQILAPGRYVIFGFTRPVAFTLGPGWSLPIRHQNIGLIERADSPNDQLRVDWVRELPDDACGTGFTPLSVEAPEAAYASWLLHDAALQVTPFVTRYLGALNVTQTDVRVVAAKACPNSDPPAINLNFAAEQWQADHRYRVAFTTLDGLLLRLEILAPEGQEFDSFSPIAGAVLETLEVGPNPSTGP